MSVPAFEDRRGRWTTCAQLASDVSARWHLESVCVCSSQYKTSFFLLNRHGRPVPTLGEQAAAEQRRVSGVVRKADEQRGAWVDLATQHVGSIAEHDPGAYAFGRA